MRIKTQIYGVALVAVVATGMTGTLAVLALRQTDEFLGNYGVVAPLVETVFALSNLTNDYLDRPRERVAQQWGAVYGRLVNELIPKLPIRSEEDARVVDDLRNNLVAVKRDFDEISARQASDRTAQSGGATVGRAQTPTGDSYLTRLHGDIKQRLAHTVSDVFSASDESLARLNRQTAGASTLMLVVSSVSAVAVLLTSFWIARRITGRLRGAMATVSSAAAEMAVTAEEQHRISSQQATSVNQTTTTMEELAASSRSSSEQAALVGQTVEGLMTHVAEGRSRADAMVEEIAHLSNEMNAIADKVRMVSEQSAQIDTITADVSEIAIQTNLLALNAAVEAVRAGEHGRGFSVVAQEIRKLADQSKASAARVRDLVADAQRTTGATVASTDGGLKTLQGTVDAVRESGDLLKEMLASFEDIAEHVEQITLTARQQSAATQQVLTAMDSLNAGAREAETGLNQTAAGIEQLKEVAAEAERLL